MYVGGSLIMFLIEIYLCCDRSTRESTPCSLIRDPDTIRTPGSSTRPTCSTETNRRTQNTMRRHIPTSQEMDEFFAAAEEDQQRQFIEKYDIWFPFLSFIQFYIAVACKIPIERCINIPQS